MNLAQLRYFKVLAEVGNFTKASERLFITQPTLSIQIKELEKEVGATFFERSKKGVTLTKEGKIFLDFVNKTITSYKDTLDAIFSKDMYGSFSLGLYWMFGYNDIGSILDGFYKSYPKVETDITVDGSVKLIKDVLDDKLDAAIVTGAYDLDDRDLIDLKKQLAILEIGTSDLVLLANKNSPLAKKEVVRFEELDGELLMHISKGSNIFSAVDGYLKDHDIHPKIIGHSSQGDICHQIAKFDLAYAFVTRDTYDHFKDKDDIVALSLVPKIERQLYFIYKEKDHNEAIQVFKEYLLERIKR